MIPLKNFVDKSLKYHLMKIIKNLLNFLKNLEQSGGMIKITIL